MLSLPLPAMSDIPPMMRLADGREVPVPPEGALGLLALGYDGLRLWREARRQAAEANRTASSHPADAAASSDSA